jgi:5'-nucleotidase
MTKAGFERDYFYVDGTPVMALLYGLDVAAQARWGKAPDLVLSGPNEGQNVGSIVLTSGTVSNAQYAGVRGIPAIAVSTGHETVDDTTLVHPNSAKVAQETARFVRHLDSVSRGGPLLPPGVALNVNFPDKLDAAKWQLTRIGTYDALQVRFVSDVGATGVGQARGIASQRSPGIVVDRNSAEPTAAQREDESVVYRQNIRIAPVVRRFAGP